MDIYSFKRVHCIGIEGIGVSAIAQFFVSNGAEVTGSDLLIGDSALSLKEQGVIVYEGHDASNIQKGVELVVYSPAIPDHNKEILRAHELQATVLSYPEVLGEISKTRPTIAITGMHGKSTTTALIGRIFEQAGKDPLVIVGTKLKEFSYGNFRAAESSETPFIVEACEYRGHMNLIHPEIVVITNIEEEHMDWYRDIDHIKETFQGFVRKLPIDGLVVRNIHDAHSMKLSIRSRSVSYGVGEPAQYRGDTISKDINTTTIAIAQSKGTSTVDVNLPGKYNLYNVMAAYACGREAGIDHNTIVKTIESFDGLWRRFEFVGEYNGAKIISDYGHHPTAIKETLKAARERYPDSRLVLVYQPHQYDRTKQFFDGFVEELKYPDFLILSDVYDVKGREVDKSVTSQDIIGELAAIDPDKYIYGGNLDKTEKIMRATVRDKDVVVVMGAGDIDSIARSIVKKKVLA